MELRQNQQAEFDKTTGTLRLRSRVSEQQLAQVVAWQDGRILLNG